MVDQVAPDKVRPVLLTSLRLASLFFELLSHPRKEDGHYHYTSVVRYRVKGSIFIDVASRLHL